MGTGSVKDSVMATGIIRSPCLPSPSTGLDPALTISSGSQQAQSSESLSHPVSLFPFFISLSASFSRSSDMGTRCIYQWCRNQTRAWDDDCARKKCDPKQCG